MGCKHHNFRFYTALIWCFIVFGLARGNYFRAYFLSFNFGSFDFRSSVMLLGGPALQNGSAFIKSGAVADFSVYGEVSD